MKTITKRLTDLHAVSVSRKSNFLVKIRLKVDLITVRIEIKQ